MQTRVPPDSSRTRTSSRRRRALASCALTIFPAITERSPSGASATVRGVRRSSYRRGRFRSRSPTVRRPFACSFSAMAGPTPRSWMTGVARGGGWRSGDSASESAGSPWPATALFLFVDGVLDEQHLEDLVLALAAGGADLHGVAHLAADQATRDRAGDADAALLQIAFRLAHDGVLHLLPGIHVLELHRRAEHDPLAGEARDVDDLRPGEAVLQHLDPPFDVRLPFLRGVVLGVLT